MKNADNNDLRVSRRQWLKRVGAGVAALAVARLAGDAPDVEASAAPERMTSAQTASAASGPERPKGRVATLEPVECVECDACMPCGYGVDIPGNFKVYNDLLAQNNVPDIYADDPESPAFARKTRRFLRVYDRRVADAHQSQRCIRCFHCVGECQQHIFIVNELAALTDIADRLRDWECNH